MINEPMSKKKTQFTFIFIYFVLINQDLIEKKGIGMLHRALFTTEKKSKKKGEEE